MLDSVYHIPSDPVSCCSLASPASLLPPVQPGEAEQPRNRRVKKKKLNKKTETVGDYEFWQAEKKLQIL